MSPLSRMTAGLALVAISLSACVSVPARDELSGPPGTTYESGKPPAAYAQCVLPKWRGERVVGGDATVEQQPAGGGAIRMTLKIAGNVGRVIEIAPQGSGSVIRYWNRSHDFGSGKPQAVETLENCR